ncbi:cupredoxin domain-containing protein [Pseudarthrobacter sp. NamE5]|uniref:cupredoxin domain-containing protein n=1 Tax=Pseudarthrobacter sp. NamE5 TaxID=2576839 RepID=UPI0014874B8E|nr:cupredoxin domain-containing protein [Pseudarthrobacter sp. NamE5]
MKTSTRTSSALGLAAAVMLALSGCGGMSGSGTTAAPTVTEQFPSASAATTEPAPSAPGTGSSSATPASILIKGFQYQGAGTVSPGAEITVTNEDIEAHTITADTGDAFDVNVQIGTTSFTAPTEPGTYPYHCNFHGNMKGTLTVK